MLNWEWLEKLPIVVLKAEEILYSKSNSEDEYTNLHTLWDRLNDVIDTIIRRDHSDDSPVLLPPCVEAALNLGCIPVRASRSQRHNNPRCYLTPRPLDHRNPDSPMNRLPPCRPDPMLCPNQIHTTRLETMNSELLISECNSSHVFEKHSLAASPPPTAFPLFYDNGGSCRVDRTINVDSSTRASDLGAVYPLYHGIHFRAGEVQSVSDSPRGNANTILVGRPLRTSGVDPKQANVTQDLLSQESLETRSNFCSGMGYVKTGKGLSTGVKCDLSLGLSLSLETPFNGKGTLDCESEDDDDSWCSLEDSVLSASPMTNSQGFCFFPRETMPSKIYNHAPCK